MRFGYSIDKRYSCSFKEKCEIIISEEIGSLLVFYGISTLVAYLIPNPIYIQTHISIYLSIYLSFNIFIRGSLNKFPDFFRMATFIDSTHMKL